MIRVPARIIRDDRGTAAIEFLLVAPVLLVLLAGLTDFALAFFYKGLLASAVGEGASYAVLAGPNVATSTIKNIISQKLAVPASDITVTGPSCYCVSGTPASTTSQACNSPCPNGRAPGTYMTVTAQYTYVAILPTYSGFSNPTMTETAMARLQ